MSNLIKVIDDANSLGYVVRIENWIGQKKITCVYKDNTSDSSIIPCDHFTDKTMVEIIRFNIERRQKKRKKDE